MDDLKKKQVFAFEVTRAQAQELPIVALESAVVTHGFPRPQNLTLARDMEQTVRAEGAIPATVGVLEGKIIVGMDQLELERLAYAEWPLKISPRNFATALLRDSTGGTTVAATMFAASKANIKVLATGGICGVPARKTFSVLLGLHSPFAKSLVSLGFRARDIPGFSLPPGSTDTLII